MGGHRQGHSADRLLTDYEARTVLRVLVVVVALTDATQGLGYVFGAPATAPSLILMRTIMPMWIWGLALAVAGGLLLWRRMRLVGFAIGGIICLVWALFAFAVLFGGTATGWAWAPYLGLAAAHVIGTWVDSQSATRR